MLSNPKVIVDSGSGTTHDIVNGKYADPVPGERFWSFTVYDNQTRSMLDTPQRYRARAARAIRRQPPRQTPTAPRRPEQARRVSDGNWIQTVPGKGWNTLLRFYSPKDASFTKMWKPSDIEEVK